MGSGVSWVAERYGLKRSHLSARRELASRWFRISRVRALPRFWLQRSCHLRRCKIGSSGLLAASLCGWMRPPMPVGLRNWQRCGLVILPSSRVRIRVATKLIDLRYDEGTWSRWVRASPRSMPGWPHG